MPSLEYIEGIGPAYAEKLRACGCGSTAQLMTMCCDRKGRAAMAAESGIDEKRILGWVNRVDLMRIRGVGSEYSDLLEAAGVDTVVELATRNAANLHKKMVETNTEKKLVRQLPTASQVADWVTQADGLPRVVSH